MNPHCQEGHGPDLTVARNAAGIVTMCPCGVVTLTMQYLSVRLEPAAFRELNRLLGLAQRRLDGENASPTAAADSAHVH